MNIPGWFPLGLTGLISLLSKGHSRVFSSTTAQKHQIFGAQLFLWSNSRTLTWLATEKTIALTIHGPLLAKWCLLFNILSRFVTAFLPRSKHLLISWLQSPSAVILEPKKRKSVLFAMEWWILMPWSEFLFLILSFKPGFSLPSFTLKRLYSSSSYSALRVVSSAYLSLLMLLPAVLIPGCDSFSSAFQMMYSACKLNKQGNNIQLFCSPFPILNQSVVPCPVPNIYTIYQYIIYIFIYLFVYPFIVPIWK